jgi:transposase-like protein
MEKIKNQARTQKGQQVVNFTEDQARDFFEQRRWKGEPCCPHCGSVNVYRLQGAATRPGLLECRDCRKQFTVTVGTVMEDSHLPLATWARAFHFMVSSKKGMSALQLQRNLGLGSYRTAWFLAHRVREAMRCEPLTGLLKGDVQIDETYVGGKPRRGAPKKAFSRGRGTVKTAVMALIESDGRAHAQPVAKVNAKTLREVMQNTVDPTARIITDDFPPYVKIAKEFGGHSTVNHMAHEYVNPDGLTSNTVEAFFALLKRGIHGTFHHVSKHHLHRYCDEFSFRWNGRKLTDTARRDAAVCGAEGKRLMLKTPKAAKDQPKQDGDQLPMF